ncbi:MAG: hypothetical protein OEL88_05680 [Sterolibacteriaceae bacterium MAG5]|nr:hypothetical protein [Candidatus Nitricoxidireducens bremensis]
MARPGPPALRRSISTTTAADCFRRLGYTDAARESVPAASAAHPQFRGLCPANAQCLAKEL